MGRILATSVIAATLLTALTLPSAAAGWEPVDEVDGVDVYERSPRYLGETALRTVAEVDAPIGQVVTVFTDPEARFEWVDRLEDQEVLQVDGDPQQRWMEQHWQRIDMPFGFSDRDHVAAKAFEFHPEQRRLTAMIRSIEDERKPEENCCVRAQLLMRFTLEAIPGEDRTRVELIAEVDLGGNLSSGELVRQNASRWPVETLRGLADRAESGDVPVDQRVSHWHD